MGSMSKLEQARKKLEALPLSKATLEALSAKKTWALRDLSHMELLTIQSFAAFGVVCFIEGVGRAESESENGGNPPVDDRRPDNVSEEGGGGT